MESPTPNVVELFIGGVSTLSSTGETSPVLNALTQKKVWDFASASEDDVDRALEAAQAAFPMWERVPIAQKRAIFLKAADLIESPKYADRIRHATASETCYAPGWTALNIFAAAAGLRETASLGSRVREGSYVESTTPNCKFLIQRRAVGVVVGISPWNASVILALRAIVIPLFAGNTVILKGSEYSPASTRIVVDCLIEAGLLPNALQFLMFKRETAGPLTNRLIAHRAVQRVSFTGSDKIGRLVAMECGRQLKQCVMELGGKAPVVVLEDANLEEAANGIVFGALVNSGQVCMSTERVIVMASVHDRLVSLIVERVSRFIAGDVSPSSTSPAHLSALFSIPSANNVKALFEQAKADGIVWAYGDAKVEGTLVQPQVLLVSREQRQKKLWTNEAFAPIVSITPVDSIDEAVDVANDSEFSLIAGLWTTNLEHGISVAERIRAGSVQVNGATIHIEPSFGNAGLGGSSGYGRFNLDAFTDMRSIGIHGPGKVFPLIPAAKSQ